MSNYPRDCQRCRVPPEKIYTPDPKATHYKAGEICSIYESTSTPVYEVLMERPPGSQSFIGSLPWKSSRSVGWSATKSSISGRSVGSGKGSRSDGPSRNPRPCVILQRSPIVAEQPRTLSICLMATFDGTVETKSLPTVLKHFAIPVHPHPQVRPGLAHAHVAPDWHKRDAWILAIRFKSSADLQGRWEDRRPRSRDMGGSYQLPSDELARLNILCNQRRSSWSVMCTSHPLLKANALNEWKNVCAEISQRRKRASAEASSSRHTSHDADAARRASDVPSISWARQPVPVRRLDGNIAWPSPEHARPVGDADRVVH
ncbi:hypothetical protein BD413DRAFT_307477 [Trametes elegans]|nr:hypothetical protein BD413DRAFT_307477 [Trametes elegans]